MTPNVKNDILAISSTKDRLHVQLSAADLAGCHEIGGTYLCNQFGVLYRNFSNTCMGALYDQKFDTAKILCEFTIEPVTDRVYSLRKNQFVIHLSNPITVPITCQGDKTGKTSTEKHLGRGPQTFTLPSGCTAQFQDHVVYSDMTIKMPSETLHFEWKWQALDMFSTPATEVGPELARLETFGVY